MVAKSDGPRAPWTRRPRVLAWRQRSRRVDLALAIVDGAKRHRVAQNGALIAHFGFLSVFPLTLVLTTVLGFVLDGRPTLRDKLVDSSFERIPIVGRQIADDPSRLSGNWVVLVLGLVTAMWAGMKAFVALHNSFDDIAEVDLDDRANLAVTRGHALVGIGVVGLTQIVAAGLASLIAAVDLGAIGTLLLVVGAIGTNAGGLSMAYRWLTTEPMPWRALAPGAIIGGVLFTGLQLIGTVIVGRAISHASAVYGTFATVIALLSWLSLHALVTLYGAELNAVLHSRRVGTPAVEC